MCRSACGPKDVAIGEVRPGDVIEPFDGDLAGWKALVTDIWNSSNREHSNRITVVFDWAPGAPVKHRRGHEMCVDLSVTVVRHARGQTWQSAFPSAAPVLVRFAN